MNKNKKLWDNISIVLVIDNYLPELNLFKLLQVFLEKNSLDSEIVIVANAINQEVSKSLRVIVEDIPDVTVYFLSEEIDRDSAYLLGMENTLGDLVILMTPTIKEVNWLENIIEYASKYEIIFAGSKSVENISFLYKIFAKFYFNLYAYFMNRKINWPPPLIRIYSRTVSKYISGNLDGEFLLRSSNFSATFSSINIPFSDNTERISKNPSFFIALKKAFKGALGNSASLLRLTVWIAIFASIIGLINSLYTIIIYFFKEDITPGWTTLSLQISFSIVIFAILFGLLSEYILGVYRSSFPRRRYSIIREIRSSKRRDENRLNIIDDKGNFKLGSDYNDNN